MGFFRLESLLGQREEPSPVHAAHTGGVMTPRGVAWVFLLLFAHPGLVAGMNLVNRATGKGLDLYAPCSGGKKESPGCQRIPFTNLTKGSNLQLYHCTSAENQHFELQSDGKIWNPLTNMCLDIQAPCKDHFRTPCERIPVNEIQKKANIQLWDCHENTGRLSNSIGNQKWTFEQGMLKNHGSGLCLGPVGSEDMDNVHAAICEGGDIQFFDLLPSSSGENFQMKWLAALQRIGFDSFSQVKLVAGAAASVGLMVAAALGPAKITRIPLDHQRGLA